MSAAAVGAGIEDPVAIRHAGAELLSLALIDARNHLLRWLGALEAVGALAGDGGREALRDAGRAGWFQEYWIGRHPRRQRGEHDAGSALRLASIEPRADAWFAPSGGGAPDDGLDAAWVRSYLAETLETTLDLLAGADDGDDALHFYRVALWHEDRVTETLAERAAALQCALASEPDGPWRALPARPEREPLWFAGQRMLLGSPPGGLVPENERWAHEVAVPAFEIDAQPVSWDRFAEFAEDGGYDRAEFWTSEGWAWLQQTGRRAPRDVEQWRGGVVVQRQGRLQRPPAAQPVLHVARHEAEAWCRWAGRRLPTEPEWELAAMQGRARGLAWGDVFEWVAGRARPWPGHAPMAGWPEPVPADGAAVGVLRGASWLTRPRWRHPKARRFVAPDSDRAFCGFRSCAP